MLVRVSVFRNAPGRRVYSATIRGTAVLFGHLGQASAHFRSHR